MAETATKRLQWDEAGKHYYETGVDHGVLYTWEDAGRKKTDPTSGDAKGWYGKGVAWSGLTSVSNDPDGADPNDFYADNIKYASVRGAENFGGSIGCYTYPREFKACNGEISFAGVKGLFLGQQTRKSFGFTYRTGVGSDSIAAGDQYKIHIVYGCTCSPSSTDYESVNDSPDAMELEFEYETTPISLGKVMINGVETELKPVAHIEIDSRKFYDAKTKTFAKALQQLEAYLYGMDTNTNGLVVTDSYLPSPDEILTILGTQNTATTLTPAV